MFQKFETSLWKLTRMQKKKKNKILERNDNSREWRMDFVSTRGYKILNFDAKIKKKS